MNNENTAGACLQSPQDCQKLAEMLFPHVEKSPADYEALYPPRPLPEGAKVTRLGPSPTGFIHLGNLFGAFGAERLAHESGGVFLLRIISHCRLPLSSASPTSPRKSGVRRCPAGP